MSAGTLTLTNNSPVVTGIGTAFTTDLVAGDFVVAVVGGTPYTLPVKTINSATSLTLVSNYTGPAQAGAAWYAVPRVAMNLVTAALVAQTTEALRGLNYDKSNWQAVFSDSGDITVILPDGTSFTGPSWKKISDLLAGLDPDELQQLADQVSTDAQQVATDRQDVDAKALQVSTDVTTASQAATNASSANATAQQAKTDAVAANAAAQQAKTDAVAAAESVNPANLLQKANNLSELVSTASAARANLAVYSTTETDTKVAAVGARIGYALITPSGNIALGARLTYTNPFGSGVPCIVMAEFYHSTLSAWISTDAFSNIQGTTEFYAGIRAYFTADGIRIVVGGGAFAGRTTGFPFSSSAETSSNWTTASPVRIHCWKVTA